MRFHKPAALALFICLGPKATQVCVQAQAQEFEFERFGDGFCLDCSGNEYDWIHFVNDAGRNIEAKKPEDCEPLCSACDAEVTTRNLRGFNFREDVCTCLFDHHDTIEFTDECTGIGASQHYSDSHKGTGDVCSTNDTFEPGRHECWEARKVTDIPTSAPSVSHVPTVTPRALVFEQFGDGFCLDCSGNEYDWIDFVNGVGIPPSTILTGEDCKPLCSACDAEVTTRNLRGFEFRENACTCLFDHHDTLEFTDECTGIGASQHYSDSHKGTGDVCSTDDTAEPGQHECWMAMDIPTSAPSVSHVPTVTPRALVFEQFGDGFCLDCSGNEYDWIAFVTDAGKDIEIKRPEDCEPLCSACDAEVTTRNLRGFNYRTDLCTCLFDHHNTIEFTDECTGIGASQHYSDSHKGTGDVCSTNDTFEPGRHECWMAAELDTNMPSPSPTTAPPTRSPFVAPSQNPPSGPSASPVQRSKGGKTHSLSLKAKASKVQKLSLSSSLKDSARSRD